MMQPQPTDPALLTGWQSTTSGNATLALTETPSGGVPALQLAFDFHGGKGFVVARRALPRAMPQEYAVHFRVRGQGAINNFELKLIDPSGQNVWRYVVENFRLPARWKPMHIEGRDIDFAWGPASGSGLSQLGFVELAIVAGEGGSGQCWITDLAIEDRTPKLPPTARASSEQPGFEALQGLLNGGWKPRVDDPRPWIEIDAREVRMFGGLVVDWLTAAPGTGFRVRASKNGRRWRTLHAASSAGGRRSNVYLPALDTRFVRLELYEPTDGAILRLQSFEYSRSIDKFWFNVAAAEPRGWHPRWLHREQSLWTPIGRSNGTDCALLNGDGVVEVARGSFSIEPVLSIDGQLYTWDDVECQQELAASWLPVPAVIWATAVWRLRIEVEQTASGTLRVRYQVENRGTAALQVRLFVVVRPFQVTPPWQSFRNVGGVSRIHELVWRDAAVFVENAWRIAPAAPLAGFGAMAFDDGFIVQSLVAGQLPPRSAVQDAFGFASGALEFDFTVAAGATLERLLHCAPAGATIIVDEPAFDWAAKLPVQLWNGNAGAVDAIRAALTATAHVLITRSGAALQPGPRRYTRSWIRDGAMMGAALLRMGCVSEVREFIDWYAPHQRADGFVPCCVDAEGVDWLIEHDSHGQLIALIADYHRFDPDTTLLERWWPHVERAVGCIARLLEADGLLPISVSHEGYLAQPVHSYWDDFWALRGVRDAAALARERGSTTQTFEWQQLADRIGDGLFKSIEATRAARKLEYVPGSVEWADFDPTATANALYLLDVPAGLDRAALDRTFAIYLADWRKKRSGTVTAANYTPYEIRIIGALVRLGQREPALELLQFFLADRRPPPWNQWPEIAWHDTRAPAHVGDLPHTWIAAEYVLAVRALFAYEREADSALILSAGLAAEWIEGTGVRVTDMPTLYGSLSYSLRRIDAHTMKFDIGAGVSAKLIVRPPLAKPLRSVMLNGRDWSEFDGSSVVVHETPAAVTCVAW